MFCNRVATTVEQERLNSHGESQNNLYSRPRRLARKLVLEALSGSASICRTQRIHTYPYRPGRRSHLNSAAVDLSTHIADIVNLIKWEELSDVVLCGHSYAGFVITGVADQIPDRIRALVYLDAFVLENGESFMDIVPSEVAQAVRDQAKATGEGWKVNPIPAHILGVRDPHDVAWVDAQCTPQAMATFEERINLTGNLEHTQDVA